MPHKQMIKVIKTGWHVFPIKKGCVFPPLVKWTEESSSDVDVVHMWMEKYPECNWGLDCGKSGLVVIDVDNKNDKSGSKELSILEFDNGRLPDTFTVSTPNNGTHLYYKGRGKNSVDKLAVGIDIRATGGYVVLPGSVTIKGEYKIKTHGVVPEAPEWVKKLVDAPIKEKPKKKELDFKLDAGKNISDAKHYLEYIAGPAILGNGGNHKTYSVACGVRDYGVSHSKACELMMEFYNPRCEPPWEVEEMDRVVRNAYEYAENSIGAKTPQADFEADRPLEKKIKTTRISIKDVVLSGTNFGKTEFPEREMLIEPWLMSQSMVMIFGARGIGKSFLGIGVTLALARGDDMFCNWRIKRKCNTLFMDAEMVAEDLKDRFLSLNKQKPLPENLFIYSDDHAANMGREQATLVSEGWRAEMKKILIELKIEVWVVDNLSSLTSDGDENDKGFWSAIDNWFINLKHCGITTVFVHHANKSGEQRGTSSREDHPDFVLKLERPGDYTLTDGCKFEVNFTKARVKNAYASQLMGIELQIHEDAATSCSNWVHRKKKRNSKHDVVLALSRGESVSEIAIWSDTSKQNVYKTKTAAVENGWLSKKDLRITNKGEDWLLMNKPKIEE